MIHGPMNVKYGGSKLLTKSVTNLQSAMRHISQDSSLLKNVQIDFGFHPASCSSGTVRPLAPGGATEG